MSPNNSQEILPDGFKMTELGFLRQDLLQLGSSHSARKTIEKKISVGILEPVGDTTYDKTFIASEILKIIHDKNDNRA